MSTQIPKYLKKHEVADLLGLSLSGLNKKMAKGEIPYTKLGRAVRFSTKLINEYLNKRTIAA